MIALLQILILSLLTSGALAIPFINLLYKLKFRNPAVKSEDMFGKKTIFNQLHGSKVGTPTGGGILVILVTIIFALGYKLLIKNPLSLEFLTLLLTIVSFGLLGFLDDLQKFFKLKKSGVFGLRIRHKFLLQIIVASFISYLLTIRMGLGGGSWWFFIYATLFITFFTNAFNITDGLDGLSGGLFLICLLPLWYLTGATPLGKEVSLFIAILFGCMLSFLYFNISPARFFMGDTGALALGAFLAVASLILNAYVSLFVMGAVFVIEGLSSLIQWGSMLTRGGKKVFRIAPLHHHFEALGWDETKIVTRFWLAGVFFAFLGLLFNLTFAL